MSSKIITTTTNTIEGAEIDKYIDLISTNVVLGTNLFSDFGASITDVFGGTSKNYAGKLQKIYSIAIDKLKDIAAKKRADAIIGIAVDFDEISGQGKSMFMISAIGTAVSLKRKADNTLFVPNNDSVSDDFVKELLIKKEIIDITEKGDLLDENHWSYMLENPTDSILEFLVDNFIKIKKGQVSFSTSETDMVIKELPNYLQVVNRQSAIDVLYSALQKTTNPTFDLISKGNFFSVDHIIAMLEKNQMNLASYCVGVSALEYSIEDLVKMKKILSIIENLEDKGEITSKKGMLGKEKEVYICPDGHENSVLVEFCHKSDCGKNIKGLTLKQIARYEVFRDKINVIESVLTKFESNKI